MDGPPGSQGVIQRKGKRHRKGKAQPQPLTTKECGVATADTVAPAGIEKEPCPVPGGAPSSAKERSTEHSNSKGEAQKVFSAKKTMESKPREDPALRDVSNPNVPLKTLLLRQLYLRAAGYSDSARPAKHGSVSEPSFVTRFDILPYPRGIINNSNYCFMNSIMQVLIFIPSFAQLAVSSIAESELCPTLSTIGKWMVQYWKPGLTKLCMQPPRLPFTMATGGGAVDGAAKATGAGMPKIDGCAQQDAQEFLQRLLEVIHAELKQLETSARTSVEAAGPGCSMGGDWGNSCADDEAGSNTRSSSSKEWVVAKGKQRLTVRTHVDKDGPRSLLLDAIFGGTLESHLVGKSKQRNHASVVVEPFYCLPIDIGFQMECSIEDAIERTMTTERIYDASRDKDLKKTLLLRQLPNVLFLHLRRWAVTAEGELVKLDNTVKFGRSLVLPRSVCHDEQLSNRARTYHLLSVVVHRGDATARGHYVTYLLGNVANPTNTSVVGPTGGNGPQPYTKVQLQNLQQPKGRKVGPQAGRNTAAASPARHALDNPAHVLLCNDGKTTVCQATEMQRETVYFLVYQRSS